MNENIAFKSALARGPRGKVVRRRLNPMSTGKAVLRVFTEHIWNTRTLGGLTKPRCPILGVMRGQRTRPGWSETRT